MPGARERYLGEVTYDDVSAATVEALVAGAIDADHHAEAAITPGRNTCWRVLDDGAPLWWLEWHPAATCPRRHASRYLSILEFWGHLRVFCRVCGTTSPRSTPRRRYSCRGGD